MRKLANLYPAILSLYIYSLIATRNSLIFFPLRIVYIAILIFSHNFFPQNPRIASLYLNCEIKIIFFIQLQKQRSIQTHVTQRCSFTFKGVENRSCLTFSVASHGDIKTRFARYDGD